MVEIKEKDIQKAAAEGMDSFLRIFTDSYKAALLGELTSDKMGALNGDQHTLLAYHYFLDEVMVGGFCQLIQNGYGPYIFENPFAKAMRLWGLKDFSKLIYRAKEIYDVHKVDLVKERTEEEFMAMYEEYEAFDEIEETFFEEEELITTLIASYVDDHIEDFATIVKE
ncbi:hypothetical protein Bcop_0806 [Bacteroides coprosuis DSM 18011]|uniref:DNA mimic protein DMP19 C-terminal domain-containing protein n=1 Tax=Bacteroides coprosuis DSM 18011 TaxID=679937 RepID=F3ZT58_9BACE|nr:MULTISPECIES: DMP19 family protein [Bacteroides]EGJ71020.1 hypothetical protein Bcop_0806 [Bacteroides coprosuis DSM 18011]HJD91556.1 DMP19 family protein [Bacteroides coprosuis]